MAKSVDKQQYSARDRLQVNINGKIIDLFTVRGFQVIRSAKASNPDDDLTGLETYYHAKTSKGAPVVVRLTHACTQKYEDKLKEINEAVSGYTMVLYSTTSKNDKEVHLKNCTMLGEFNIASSDAANNPTPESVFSDVTFQGIER